MDLDQQQKGRALLHVGPRSVPGLFSPEDDPSTTSPVTDLARNLGGLCTGRRLTPRRRISWSSGSEDTPDSCRTVSSFKTGFHRPGFADSPVTHMVDSPMFQDRLLRDVSVADNCLNTAAVSGGRTVRRVRTLPCTIWPHLQEATEKENIPKGQSMQTTSPLYQPKGLLLGKNSSPQSDSDSRDSGCSLLEQVLLSNQFPVPSHPPPKKTISPLKTTRNILAACRQDSAGSSIYCSSSERSSVGASGTDCDDPDDGFSDVFAMDLLDSEGVSSVGEFPVPSGFHQLLKGPLSSSSSNIPQYSDEEEDEAVKNSITSMPASACTQSPKRRPPIRRCLSMIEESPVCRPFSSSRDMLLKCIDLNNNCGNIMRRPEETRKRLLQDLDSPVTFKKPCEPDTSEDRLGDRENMPSFENKRRRSVNYLAKSSSDSMVLTNCHTQLQRSHSETEAITRALQISTHNPNLIGDCTGTFALPLVKGRHDDLKAINSTTLSNLINGMYSSTVDQFAIVDCRYPYEFDGGHIKGALNLYTKESILDKLIHQQSCQTSRSILIFHCEFSSERGPNLCRFLRNKDREANKDNYPNLFHPEIYLLEGGYREFYRQHKELCVPQDYLPMLSKDHEMDLKKFRSKSKSWSGDTKSRIAYRPGLKL